MCGIYGILSLRGSVAPTRELLDSMGDRIVHRGPDDSGAFVDREFGFGMRRLSIIDVAGGHQPLFNEDESVAVICNGEIYNFRSLREQLLASGHRFRTGSDAEVIVHLYEEHGDGFVQRLRGMFGLALWDRARRRLVLARDATGIKPLYVQRSGGAISFASEAKSLLALAATRPQIDPQSLADYLSLGYVPAPRSMFLGIEKLLPGHTMVVEDGKETIERWWRGDGESSMVLDEAEAVTATREAIERSVVSQMVSDVPLGAFLSGGIDSSAVVAFMARNSDRRVQTFSIGFKGSSGSEVFNELPYARRVAELFGTDHQEIIVDPDVFALLPKLLWHMDEPVADSAAVTTYLVSEFAAKTVKVILSGVGGDEVFAGYNRYLDAYYGEQYERIPGLIRRGIISPLVRLLPTDRHHRLYKRFRYARAFVEARELCFEDRYRSYVQVLGERRVRAILRGAHDPSPHLQAAFAASVGRDPVARMMAVDQGTQLPDDLLALTDRMTMAASIECRVPLLDEELVMLAGRIPGSTRLRSGRLKHVMKEALAGILPNEVLERGKRGFGAPMGAWFKKELIGTVNTILAPQVVADRGLLDPEEVSRIAKRHFSGAEDNTDALVALLNLELWCRVYLDGTAPEEISAHLRTAGSQ